MVTQIGPPKKSNHLEDGLNPIDVWSLENWPLLWGSWFCSYHLVLRCFQNQRIFSFRFLKIFKIESLCSSIFENFFWLRVRNGFLIFFNCPYRVYIYIPCPYPSSLGLSKEKTSSQHWFETSLNGLAPPTPPILSFYCGLQIANNLRYINSILWETNFWAIYYFLHLPSTISSHTSPWGVQLMKMADCI